MKQGWIENKLEECLRLKSGDALISKVMNENGEYPVFGGNGIAGLHNEFNLQGSNVIIGRVGALCGNVRHLIGKIWLTDNAFRVVDLYNKFDHSFLTYLLNFKNLRSYARQAAQPVISNSSLKDVLLYFPESIEEQQRIVAKLDEAFEAIEKAKANAEHNLKNAKELFESYLQAIFENKGKAWEEKTLGEISKDFGRGKSKHRPRNWDKLYGGDYPFIQTGDIRNCNHVITEYTQTYSDIGLAQSKLWPAGTICITIAANIAETGVLTFNACFPDSVIGLVVNDKFADRDYVEYLLQSFKSRLQALGKGSAQDNINLKTFENRLFPFPKVSEQQTIVQKLDAISAETKKLEAIYHKKLEDLEELKKSILQKAFSGQL